jgi:hypothetical protein
MKTQKNDPEVKRDVLASFDLEPHSSPVAFFEHGQWWVECKSCGAQWGVHDAEDARGNEYFDFEQVSDGDGSCDEEQSEPYMDNGRKALRPRVNWWETASGTEKYRAARRDAQTRADQTGYDHGIERNDLFKNFRVFMLPRRENRHGHELRCEVVMCSDLARCQPGHGPMARNARSSGATARLSRSRGERQLRHRGNPQTAEPASFVISWEELKKDLGLPSDEDWFEATSEGESDAGQYAYDEAFTQAIEDDEDEEEAERLGELAREKAWEEYSGEQYREYQSAIERAVEQYLGFHDLDYTDLGDGTLEIAPRVSWAKAADAIRETINGVGMFGFDSLEDFIESSSCENAADCVKSHLHHIKDYGAVYGEPSPLRIYKRALR